MENLRDLSQRFVAIGQVETIVLRPVRKQPAISVSQVQAVPGLGLVGDRRAEKEYPPDSPRKREITLIQAEHLPLIAQWCGLEAVTPLQLRRNLVISGINLLAMRSPFRDLKVYWQIGSQVQIEVTGPCDPCSRMELDLGLGAYNAIRGHGGMTARLIAGGEIRVGDSVRYSHHVQN